MGVSGGGVFFIPLNTFLIEKYGWENAWLVLGFITLISIVPLSFLYMRRQPEDMNLLPDGETKVDDNRDIPSAADLEISWTVKEASKTSSLWLLILSFNLMTMSIGATLLNQVPYLTDKNLGIGMATVAATSFGFVAMAAKIAPVFATWIYDSTGNYDIAFFVFAVGCFLGVVFILFAKAPIHSSIKK